VEKVTIWIKNHFNEASSFLAAIFILGAVIYVFAGQPVAAGAFSLSAAISILSLVQKMESDRKNRELSLGVSSPMAKVVFEKYALFCEEYLNALNEAIASLMREGPQMKAVGEVLIKLQDSRRKYEIWIEDETVEVIGRLETGLLEIWKKENSLKNTPVGDERAKLVNEVYDLFSRVLGLAMQNGQIDESIAIKTIKDEIKKRLGVANIHKLRRNFI